MNITLYHNPKCGTSRNVLALLKEKGEEPKIIEYLKTPLNHGQLVDLLKCMNISARTLLREKEPIYQELGLDDPKWRDEDLLNFMVAHPILMNRPIVVTPKGAALCRPTEKVLELL